jgi:hypothetical protein
MWPFKRRQAKAQSDSQAVWSVARGEHNDAPMFIRIRQDPRPGLTAAYSHRVGFAVPLRTPDSRGLPQGAEFEDLARIEDLLASTLESEGASIQVLSITTSGMREFVFYTCDPERIQAVVPTLQAQVRSHQLQSYIEPDPDWSVYQEFSSGPSAA